MQKPGIVGILSLRRTPERNSIFRLPGQTGSFVEKRRERPSANGPPDRTDAAIKSIRNVEISKGVERYRTRGKQLSGRRRTIIAQVTGEGASGHLCGFSRNRRIGT